MPEASAQDHLSIAENHDQPGSHCETIDREYIVQWFSPRWYIFIMGTGAVAIMHQLLAGGTSGIFHQAAVFLLLAAAVAFPIVSAFKLWRLASYFWCVAEEWRHSSLIQFYSTIPIAASVVSTGFLNIPITWMPDQLQLNIAIGLWALSLVLSVAFVVFIPLRIILGDHAEPRRALGFWFLPPVGLFVFVFNGNFLSGKIAGSALAPVLFQLNTAVLGLALFLTVAIFTIFLFRALFYRLPRPDVTPSYTIGLAPIGVAIVAVNSYMPLYARFAPASLPAADSVAPMVLLGSLLLWGFGLWWAFIVAGIIATRFRHEGVPVTLGYWAFIFPPAAFTISTLMLGAKLQIGLVSTTGIILAGIVTAAWIAVLATVIKHTINRNIFKLAPSFEDLNTEGPHTKAS